MIDVLHITDCHLLSDPNEQKNRVKPLASLRAVLAEATVERQPDAIVATGDLCNDATAENYRIFIQCLKEIADCPVICCPGNHDLTKPFEEVCPMDALNIGGWYIDALDTHVDHDVQGHVQPGDVKALLSRLDETSNHKLVLAHHPLLPIDCEWIDVHRPANGDDVIDELRGSQNLRAVLSGHVHQESDLVQRAVRQLTSPSTCWQFARNSPRFAFGTEPPGWRWLHLHSDGSIDTKVYRLPTE